MVGLITNVRTHRSVLALVAALSLVFTAAAPSSAADDAKQTFTVVASDGVKLTVTLTAPGGIAPRPTVVEFSPYGRDSGTLATGSDFNQLLVQLRGTGDSNGTFDALGPRTQQDVKEVLQWACDQPWSGGKLAINGFSASAITIYNSLHLQLPCVKAMVLRSGTFSLYRDLLMPGGISNLGPAAGVMLLIGAPALIQSPDRISDPASGLALLLGLLSAGLEGGFAHPTLDSWWQQREFRGDVNHVPTLILNGFFDVESRGAFQAYQQLRSSGAHMLLVGGHDGAPAGTDDGVADANRWLDHFVRGVDNGIDAEPRVQMLMSRGDREDYLKGDFTRRSATNWPLPGTTWSTLSLSTAKSGAGHALSDGSLLKARALKTSNQTWVSAPSLPTATDIPTTALLGASGLNALTAIVPLLTKMTLADAVGLTYSTQPLAADVASAGPLALNLTMSTTTPGTGIWAVVSDVSPDGVVHPLTVGRLNTDFPNVVAGKSLSAGGRIVQPYGDYSKATPAKPLAFRSYKVEFWPVGNVFEKGHRIRLTIVGPSAASKPSLPAVNVLRVGGLQGAQLMFPVLPGSNLNTALSK
jgi:predicted acyl esterase